MLRLINHSGIAKDADGRALTGPLGVTVALYKDKAAGAPVRLETQIVQAAGNLLNANPGRRDAPKDVKIRKDLRFGVPRPFVSFCKRVGGTPFTQFLRNVYRVTAGEYCSTALKEPTPEVPPMA